MHFINETLLVATKSFVRALPVRVGCRSILAKILALACLWGVVAVAEERPNLDANAQLAELDGAFQAWSDQFYRTYLQRNAAQSSRPSEALNLSFLVESIQSSHPRDAVMTIAQIKSNVGDFQRQSDSAEFLPLLGLLYRYNETATVKAVTDRLQAGGDEAANSQNYFLLAQYYYARENWIGVNAALARVDSKHLSTGDGHYTDLLYGYALQARKQHRDALKYYKRVPSNSPYYKYVKLNEGTAYLRQGWWTEAHLEFERAIAATDDPDFRDRVLVTLGFSQLHHEFYRDARQTLRKVSLNGRHTNKALMGLGVTAAYQEDFAGALNAFVLLSEKSDLDSSVDESFLLIPPAYEQRGDAAEAAEAYRRAIAHYEERLAQLHQTQLSIESHDGPLPQLLEVFNSRADGPYNPNQAIPAYFLENYRLLTALAPLAKELGLDKSTEHLQGLYETTVKQLYSDAVAVREEVITGYLSQARYGVAKLYDNR